MEYAIVATDSYFVSTVRCAVTPRYVALHVTRTAALVVSVKADTPFRFLIPQTDLFEASDPFALSGVTLEGAAPLPLTLTFTASNNLHGSVPFGVTRLVAVASTDRTDAFFAFVINATNLPPRTVGAWPPLLCRAGAPLDFRGRVDSVFADADDEVLHCHISEDSTVPSWLSASIAGSGRELLVRASAVPTSAHAANFTIDVNCSDGLAGVVASLRIVVGRSAPPNMTRPLQPIVVTAGTSTVHTVTLREHWRDPDDDPVSFVGTPTVIPQNAASWLRANYEDRNQRLQLTLSPSTEDEGSAYVNVTVADHFGNQTVASVEVQVHLTWQQKLQWLWNVLSTVFGVVVTVVGAYWVLPLANNVFRYRSLVQPCPLYEHESFQLDKRAATVDFLCPGPVSRVRALAQRFVCCSEYLRLSTELVPLPTEDPPPWLCINGRFISRVADAECNGVKSWAIREYSQYGFMLADYYVSFDELHARIGAEMATADARQGTFDEVDVDDILGMAPPAAAGVGAEELRELREHVVGEAEKRDERQREQIQSRHVELQSQIEELRALLLAKGGEPPAANQATRHRPSAASSLVSMGGSGVSRETILTDLPTAPSHRRHGATTPPRRELDSTLL